MNSRMRVEPSLHWHEAFGVSERHRRLAKKWPWSWCCMECDDAQGAAKTRPEAQRAADEHELKVHGSTSQTSLASAQGQPPPIEGEQMT